MKVSVIIPTYNRANLLKKAIESVLNQTFQDFELIVADDGSTDNTREVVESFEDLRTRQNFSWHNLGGQVKYIWQENSGGAAKPKNEGIKIAKGKYIAVLDSDDEWLPDKLEKQIAVFEKSKNVQSRGSDHGTEELGVVGCDIFIVESDKKKIYRMPKHNNIFKRMLVTDDLGTGSTMVYKKEVFDKVGLFDENLKSGQDREMRLRISQHYDFAFVPEPLVNYYYEKSGIATKGLNIEKREKDWQYIFEKYKDYYLKDKKLYSDKLRYEGTRYIILGYSGKAQKSFLKSIVKNPLNFKSYFYFLLSFLGDGVYNNLSKIKLWIKQQF